MRTRNLWLLTGLLGVAAAAIVAGPTLVASPDFDLRTAQPGFVSGGVAELNVSIDPIYIGGHADLYRTVAGQTEFVKSFPLSAPAFIVEAEVPSEALFIGQVLSFQYEAFSVGGMPIDYSRKVRRPIVEPELE